MNLRHRNWRASSDAMVSTMRFSLPSPPCPKGCNLHKRGDPPVNGFDGGDGGGFGDGADGGGGGAQTSRVVRVGGSGPRSCRALARDVVRFLLPPTPVARSERAEAIRVGE